ncbi:hypothetical protein F5148DRAFT_1194629 [Russula earlei]|uniref:Uncharacterized protein n=1 Tax=Russula earlei TaxID=71964 RepID=A0ACC0UAG3_9AGAM|nr:hypothetical protein F5148DRAFT_1194629 [Russula earlei]
MRFRVYFLLAGTGFAAANPLHVMISTTEVSAFRLGHPAANPGPSVVPDTKPTRMRHLCKNMQNAVQDTTARLLSIIGIGVPSLAGPAPASAYHKLAPVPVIDSAFVIKVEDHGVHKIPKDRQPQASFLHRVHHALMSLGPWEGRIVAFVLGCGIGVLLRMFWVLAVLLARSVRTTPEREEETIFVYAEEVAPPYGEKLSNS